MDLIEESAARAEIAGLVYLYADRVDAGDFEAVAQLLADAEVSGATGTAAASGAEAVLTMFASAVRRYDDGTPLTHHITTNLRVDVAADGTAVAHSCFLVLQAVPGSLGLQPIITGDYHDRFERRDGSWRFTARRIAPRLTGDLSQHLMRQSDSGHAVPR